MPIRVFYPRLGMGLKDSKTQPVRGIGLAINYLALVVGLRAYDAVVSGLKTVIKQRESTAGPVTSAGPLGQLDLLV
ncbi:hypothetical protein CMUST_01855 [Corynebacterium mustelae]|uniref:Uncharacterized protein n=1 Tax=Corynebacterium mustelae TaxID=571915 RepID=A0A0G3GUA8_9CORY|nr:hypothetical protein [Corynebacterium mustelae]AKK04719.1 hypothetical protein CMUST_01855 [Corynebacterium mustelae]